MMNKRETEELIERYCMGQLSPEELRIFEEWRESDSDLSQAIDDHRLITDAFLVYAERSDLKKKLGKIHDEMESDQYRFQAPMKVIIPRENRVKLIWRKYKLASIAAVLSLVAISASIITFSVNGVSGNKQQSAYQELRREVERIKRSQKALIKDINNKQESTVIAEGAFTGSGFALNKEGYVLTSYHVVADASSIYISNEKFAQLKMKVIYTNPELDMAVLKVDDKDFIGFKEIPYTMRKSVADPGEKVYTLGYPREDMVFGEGSVSSYTGFEGDTAAYQISIPVNPGNSGGPLFDSQGNLIGIVSGRNSSAEGASFAVKSKWISEDIKEHSAEKISMPMKKTSLGSDRAVQVKKVKDFVFMVKVMN
ncbi:MAG: trypsin-like peptidase domain-containing protein [Bacteroidetes bacterium]|nr:trypsin-like peptidase domain-containing protein [Bacteroidota bacterium]